MTDPQKRIEDHLRAALKAGRKEQLSVLRMLLADMQNERIRSGGTVDEEAFLGLVRRGIKQRRDAAGQFERGNRAELAAQETREAEFLLTYLPAEVDAGDIQQAIDEIVAAEGLAGPGDIGPLMKALMARFRGTADGAIVNRLARQALSQPKP